MTKEKWLDLKEKISEKFTIEKQQQSNLEDVPDSFVESLIFNSPLGKIKLEWVSKPKTLGEHTNYSKRIGGHVEVEKIYSDTERAEYLKVYKFDNEDWVEISSNDFSF